MSNFLPSLGAEVGLDAEAVLPEPDKHFSKRAAAGLALAAVLLTGCSTRAETGLPVTDPTITCLRIVDGAKVRSSPSVPGQEEAKDHNLLFTAKLSEGSFLTDLRDVTKDGKRTVRLENLFYVEKGRDNNGTWYGIPRLYTQPLQEAAKTTIDPKQLVVWVNHKGVINCSKEKK